METIFPVLLQTIPNPFKHQIQIMCPPISFNVKFVIETWQKHAWTTSISYLLRLNCSLFRHEYSDVRLIINKSWTHVNTSETQSLGKRTQQEGNNSDRHKITDSIHITVVNQHSLLSVELTLWDRQVQSYQRFCLLRVSCLLHHAGFLK